ncbi:MAG: hypothetical protein LBK40_04380, partial [Spirochaetaceae bacterium]|nr:hypothetical protein [Spirochaetaceae bacterium]
MKTMFRIMVVLFVFLPLVSCAPPVQSGDGNVRIVLSDGVRSLVNRQALVYKLDFSGPGGESHIETSQGQESVSLSLEAGDWTVQVKAYHEALGNEIFGWG